MNIISRWHRLKQFLSLRVSHFSCRRVKTWLSYVHRSLSHDISREDASKRIFICAHVVSVILCNLAILWISDSRYSPIARSSLEITPLNIDEWSLSLAFPSSALSRSVVILRLISRDVNRRWLINRTCRLYAAVIAQTYLHETMMYSSTRWVIRKVPSRD